MKINILAFGAHPDDVELCASGTLLRHKALGYSTGIIDLTRGELGTRGNAELRTKEAEKAAKIIDLDVRVNLDMADGFFENNKDNQLKIVRQIRKYQPDVILANAIRDRHTDHGRAAELVANAAFLAGLRKIETQLEEKEQQAWRPKALYHYVQDRYIPIDLAVDITDFMDKKLQSIMAYESQFYKSGSNEPSTPISSEDFFEFVKARAREFGRQMGATFGEGYTVQRYIGVDDLMTLK